MTERTRNLPGNRQSTPIPCWLCGGDATRQVKDMDTGEVLLTCEAHQTAAFS